MTLAISAAAVLAMITLFGFADGASAATTFNPTLKVTVSKTTPDTPSDYVVDFGVPKGDVNFAGVVSFIPLDWGVVKGDSFPIGTAVGSLDAKATLGLINGACNTALPVHFDFKNSSINTADTVAYDDADKNNTADFAEDKDKNGNFDGVDKYPDFLTRVFKDLQPIRRSAGLATVAGLPILLQFLIFAPGTEVNTLIPHDENLGFPTVTVLTNIGDPDAVPVPGAITDFCSPLASVNNSLGAAKDGTQLFVNPLKGKYNFVTVAVGQRDADGDGYENALDTCPLLKNVGNPRVAGDGDADQDGLDAACDPNDNDVNSDQDLDGYLNRQDNCPLIPNGQPNDPSSPGPTETNQADKDLDGIGDACDPHPDNADTEGTLSVQQLQVPVTIGDGTGAGGPPTSCDKCFKLGEATTAPGSTSTNTTSGGGSSNTWIFIVIGVIAAVVVIGGGAFFMMRKKE